jgi:probable F420-dependent oxidoreductase
VSGLKVGLALENFSPAPKVPQIKDLLSFAREAEARGFDSLFVWDHLMLGTKTPFPFLESLSTLSAISVVTETVTLGTGVLVLPVRNPVVLAKVTSTLDQISGGRLMLGLAAGWYEREFDAVGVPFKERGAIFERNFEILNRFWKEDAVEGSVDGMVFRRAVMQPKPAQQPRPTVLFGGYVDRVLHRVARLADGWLTYFYEPEPFARSWKKIRAFAEESGRDPDTLTNVSQLPICVDASFEAADRRVKAFIERYFDIPPWSDCSLASAIRGTPEQCLEQLAAHAEVGVKHAVLIPCEYALEQVQAVAEAILPWAHGYGASEARG